MYLHPQETSYSLSSLFDFLGCVDLRFAGFSNPEQWDPARLLTGELLERARALPPRQQWELVETLDPDISHFEFFLARPPLPEPACLDDAALPELHAERNRCLWGWPSLALFGPDLQPLTLEPGDLELLQALEAAPAGTRLGQLAVTMTPAERLGRIRRLLQLRVLLPVIT
jgi:hypothetical protein